VSHLICWLSSTKLHSSAEKSSYPRQSVFSAIGNCWGHSPWPVGPYSQTHKLYQLSWGYWWAKEVLGMSPPFHFPCLQVRNICWKAINSRYPIVKPQGFLVFVDSPPRVHNNRLIKSLEGLQQLCNCILFTGGWVNPVVDLQSYIIVLLKMPFWGGSCCRKRKWSICFQFWLAWWILCQGRPSCTSNLPDMLSLLGDHCD